MFKLVVTCMYVCLFECYNMSRTIKFCFLNPLTKAIGLEKEDALEVVVKIEILKLFTRY